MKTVIMSGGKGTRISELFPNIPKPLIQISGKPVLEYEIECLKEHGFTDIILTVSHMADKIIDYFGDGSRCGVHLEYFVEDKPLGNAGALFRFRDRLTEDFLLLNADALFDIDFNRFVGFHREKGGLATLFTHPNDHPYDSGVIVAGRDKSVKKWFAKEEARPEFYKNRVNAGLHIISPKLLENDIDLPKIDLDRHLLKPLAGTGKMFCYDSPEYVKDMGTPERFMDVAEDLESGKVSARNMRNKQKAIFLDRDGTINKYKGFLCNAEDFELLPTVSEAIRMINRSGYLAIVVTNQPVIARGEATFGKLDEIHNKMETLLGRDGAYIDGIYFCPHHPDSGFEGEVRELKFECGCRKPKPGMLLQAAKDFNIDLKSSWMIGDGEHDKGAGESAGCKTKVIPTDGDLLKAVKEILEDTYARKS